MIILLKNELLQQIKSSFCILILIIIMATSSILAISIYDSTKSYINSEMDRLGFGDLTMWVSGAYDENELSKELTSTQHISHISSQELIFSGYSIGNVYSDDEGQLIRYSPEDYEYRIFNNKTNGYITINKIQPGEIYISPAMAEHYGVKIGDDISFRLTRNETGILFKITGYFEDPFMGSSMIDMKSFLIGEEDYKFATRVLNESDKMNVLGRIGRMVHIFKSDKSELTASELIGLSEERISKDMKVEFSYSKETILGYMLLLQKIVIGFLLTFAVIGFIICNLIIGYSISSSIEEEYKDFGIIKAIGCTNRKIRLVQLIRYLMIIFIGIILGIIISILLIKCCLGWMVSSSGILTSAKYPIYKICQLLSSIMILFILLIIDKTRKISRIHPIQAIRGYKIRTMKYTKTTPVIHQHLLSFLAVRQIHINKIQYFRTSIIACLLMVLLVTVDKMNMWVGPNGEGLMNSFSVAAHDLGVEPNHSFDMSQVETIITKYANIEETYELAMQKVTINQREFTANVLDKPEWFQIQQGRTVINNDEIIVTEYVTDDLGVQIGDYVEVCSNNQNEQYKIVGVYTCANQMGANIGMTKDGYGRINNIDDYIWCKHYILSDSSYNDDIMKAIQEQFPMDVDVHTNSWSGLGSIVSTMKLVTGIMYIIVGVIIVLVVIMTSSKLLQQEQMDLAILKSQGMTTFHLRISFMFRFGFVAFIGILAGEVISIIFANGWIENLLKSFGISNFNVKISIQELSVLPIMLLVLFMVVPFLYSRKIQRVDIVQLIRE